MGRRRIYLLIIDVLIALTVSISTYLLFNGGISSLSMINKEHFSVKILVLISIITLWRFILLVYRAIWRYANSNIYLRLIISDFISFVSFVLVSYVFKIINPGFAYSILTVCLICLATIMSRIIYQVYYSQIQRHQDIRNMTDDQKLKKVVIIGAGNTGSALAEEFKRNPLSKRQVCFFIDIDKSKIGNLINGLPIVQEGPDALKMIKDSQVEEIVVALPDSDSASKQQLYDYYRQTALPVRIYDHNIEGNSIEGRIRDFEIEDLLFREPIEVNNDITYGYYRNKKILVTGGGGSIGSELCRQLAKLQPLKLIILDIYENNAYDIQQELLRKYANNLDMEVVIASVRDSQRIEEIFELYRPEIVFHAAAHKHVPLMEDSGCEAIKNNVFGTFNVANVAEKYGVEKFVLISTDKAVNPTNIMGASKRLCEMIIQCRNDSKTKFAAVRFGNVLGSNGSVIPLFKKQIKNGGPLTITDKRIIRYFMTIPEAVGLVMEAGAIAEAGQLFVLNMGKPVSILKLAETMIELMGFIPYKDIEIKEIGLRPGEKLYEELLMANESLSSTDNEMIFIEKDTPFTREQIAEKLDILAASLNTSYQRGHYAAVVEAIRATVPTFIDANKANEKFN